MTQFQDMNAAYREVFTKDFPAHDGGHGPDGRGRGRGDHVHGGEIGGKELTRQRAARRKSCVFVSPSATVTRVALARC
jgi:hypothetical protein